MLSHVQRYACWALRRLSDGSAKRMTSSIIAGGGIDRLKRAEQMYEEESAGKRASEALGNCGVRG